MYTGRLGQVRIQRERCGTYTGRTVRDIYRENGQGCLQEDGQGLIQRDAVSDLSGGRQCWMYNGAMRDV